MKLEFIKEEKFDGPIYYTKVDGDFLSGSLALDEVKGRELYEKSKARVLFIETKEVIESIEI